MLQKIQRLGGAMFTPVLLFAFAGIMVGLSILFKNPEIVGSIAAEGSTWYNLWTVIEEGSWTVFRQLPLLFVIGLPIGLAKKQQARACMEALVLYLTFNYFINALLTLWGPTFGVDINSAVGGVSGLTTIAGIKTLDTGMVGSILIASVVIWLHNKFFDVELPEVLGVFRGSSFVVMLGFFVMIPIAVAIAFIWPKVQDIMGTMQNFLIASGELGVWIYAFLERALIPTGLHHFVAAPFIYDNIIVDGGIASYWATNLGQFATSTLPLKELFPAGGFSLHGLAKVFGSIGISLAFYFTAKPGKKKKVAGLLIPVTLTAVLAGITEPLDFTFLFISPALFIIHAALAATITAVSYYFGVVGNFCSGLIDWTALNWLPLFKNHSSTYITQIIIGVIFIGIWFLVFRYLILKFDIKTPGREDDEDDIKLYSKKEYENKEIVGDMVAADSSGNGSNKAEQILAALGGKENIDEINNCATRLRISVKNPDDVQDVSVFKSAGAHGLVKNGKAVQVIIGLSVAKVRDDVESLL